MRRAAFTALLLAVPLAGLFLLLGVPDLDVAWEHHPAHFWLVLVSALLSFLLGFLMAEAAARRGDARVLLVALAFLASSGFLALHALATPGRAPGREELRLPDRLGDRAPHRLRVRRRVRAAARRRLGPRGPARAPAPARLGRHRARRLGGARPGDAAAARRGRSRRRPRAIRSSPSGRSGCCSTGTPPSATPACTSGAGRPSRWRSPRRGCCSRRPCSPSPSPGTGTSAGGSGTCSCCSRSPSSRAASGRSGSGRARARRSSPTSTRSGRSAGRRS